MSAAQSAPAANAPPDALASELDPGETALWWGQPSISGLLRRRLPRDLCLPLIALPGPVFALTAMIRTQLDVTAAGASVDWNELFVLLYASLSALLAWLLWHAVSSPWKIASEAKGTFYAVTPRRIIFVQAARRIARVTSYEPIHPLRLERVDRTGGRGDIILMPPVRPAQSNASPPVPPQRTLESIPHPHEVERLIRNTFEPPAGARRFPRT